MHEAIPRSALRSIFVFAALLCLAIPGCAKNQVFDETFPLESGGRFELDNINGSVQVSGWEREQVEIHAVKTARRGPEDLDQVKIEVETHSGQVAVHTRYPQGDGVEVAVEYSIHVPYRVLLSSVGTVNGKVSVTGVEGNGTLRSVNGDVEVVDSAGRFSARTTNGDVRLELRRLVGVQPMALSTVNGSVVLALPDGAGADLDAHSLNGDFHSELPVEAPGGLNPRGFRGRLGRGGAEVSIRTVNGRIRVVQGRPNV